MFQAALSILGQVFSPVLDGVIEAHNDFPAIAPANEKERKCAQLIRAIRRQDEHLVRVLMNYSQVDPNLEMQRGEYKWPCFYFALFEGSREILRIVIGHPRITSDWTHAKRDPPLQRMVDRRLSEAIHLRDDYMVRFLLKYFPIDPDAFKSSTWPEATSSVWSPHFFREDISLESRKPIFKLFMDAGMPLLQFALQSPLFFDAAKMILDWERVRCRADLARMKFFLRRKKSHGIFTDDAMASSEFYPWLHQTVVDEKIETSKSKTALIINVFSFKSMCFRSYTVLSLNRSTSRSSINLWLVGRRIGLFRADYGMRTS
jgi:hypothetical protein